MSIWLPEIKDTKAPRYKAIVEALEGAIRSRQLHPGQQLPTQRELARKLGISVQTVAKAYIEAQRKGLTSGEIGRGTFVQYPRFNQSRGSVAHKERATVFDFSDVTPVVSDLHVEALKQAMLELAKDPAIKRLLERPATHGLMPHRKAGAVWLERNGVDVLPDEVVVTNGAAHGIWIAMANTVTADDTIATEALAAPSIISNASRLHLRLRGIELDDQGIIPQALEDAHEREPIKLLCITPSYNNPTVSLMQEPRRAEIADLARRHDMLIVEHDVFGPLMPRRPKPIWHFAPERTFYVSSLSQTVMSSLRCAYLVGPAPTIAQIMSRLPVPEWMGNTWTAEVASRWLYDGTADRLIDWQRRKLEKRNKMVTNILGLSEAAVRHHAMHVWLHLPEQWRSRHFVEQARSRGVLVPSPDSFIVGRAADPRAIRIALGDTNRDDDQFSQGIHRIATLLQESPEPVTFSTEQG
ncbi:MocR-like ectoine utilization transcription factor EhuR [Mesorhizobium sp. 43Arga]